MSQLSRSKRERVSITELRSIRRHCEILHDRTPGKVWRFSKSGRRYAVEATGAYRRVQ